MVIPVVMYRCESWTIKKAKHWRTDAFKLWCWRRLLRVPWTARRSNQSILKEISPEYSLEGLMPKLKLWYFGHLLRKVSSLEKTQRWEMIGGRRRSRQQRVRWLNSIIDAMDMSLSKLSEIVKNREVCINTVHGVTESDTTKKLKINNPGVGLASPALQTDSLPMCHQGSSWRVLLLQNSWISGFQKLREICLSRGARREASIQIKSWNQDKNLWVGSKYKSWVWPVGQPHYQEWDWSYTLSPPQSKTADWEPGWEQGF